MKIVIINGPNLNLLGVREKSIYGEMTFDEYFSSLKKKFVNFEFLYFQTNIEGEIVDLLQKHGFSDYKIILNAGGYTHTSVAIADAISAINADVVEVHISNIYAREEYRRNSLLSSKCKACICGFGLTGYELAVVGLKNMLQTKAK
jgi:3-dehydroquinate dehydratase-2